MWKIALSAVLTIFSLAWMSVIATQIAKKFFDDDDNWPSGGSWVTP